MRLYSTPVLTFALLAALAANTFAVDDGLVAHWNLDEGTGT